MPVREGQRAGEPVGAKIECTIHRSVLLECRLLVLETHHWDHCSCVTMGVRLPALNDAFIAYTQ